MPASGKRRRSWLRRPPASCRVTRGSPASARWPTSAGLAPPHRPGFRPFPRGRATLGPGRPHLLVFFATWLTETSDLRAELTALSRYARAERGGNLPQLVAVDE